MEDEKNQDLMISIGNKVFYSEGEMAKSRMEQQN
jgi:hypothetical protein